MKIKRNDVEFEIRMYREGDEKDILKLFKIVFNKQMTIKFWKWRFMENPFGKGIIALAYDGNILASHYAVMPIHLKVCNSVIKAVFSMTTMTHPEYRGRGLFPKLAKLVYEEAKRKKYSLVYGFPNENSYMGFVKKLNWIGFGKIPVYTIKCDTTPLKKSKAISAISIKEVDSFKDDVDNLWNKVKKYFLIAVPRTKEYLNWRFVKNPDQRYFIFSMYNSSDIKGYFVLKIYEEKNKKLGHVIDLVVDEYRYIKDILAFSIDFFKERDVNEITLWLNEVIANKIDIEKFGAKKSFMERTYFGCRVLKDIFYEDTLKDFKNWYITMGDSDVF